MYKTTNATPRPWHTDAGRIMGRIIDEDSEWDRVCATTRSEPCLDDETEARMVADEMLIIRAVNSYEALVEALRECITEDGAVCFTRPHSSEAMNHRIRTINVLVHAALANAATEEDAADAATEEAAR